MDSMGKVMIVMAGGTTVTMLARTIANAVIRYTEIRRRGAEVTPSMIQERLERIEIAVDAIAIEVERLGEHHRFNAQLALNRPEPLPSRVVTPH
jgi:hypothetical protein